MSSSDFQTAIDSTKAQIYQIKKKIEQTPDSKEKRRLQRQLKELQVPAALASGPIRLRSIKLPDGIEYDY